MKKVKWIIEILNMFTAGTDVLGCACGQHEKMQLVKLVLTN